jgi:hypothetical protein
MMGTMHDLSSLQTTDLLETYAKDTQTKVSRKSTYRYQQVSGFKITWESMSLFLLLEGNSNYLDYGIASPGCVSLAIV